MPPREAILGNDLLLKENPSLFSLFSERGKNIYFPRLGILSQSADAKATKLNATIGIATNDNKAPLHLTEISNRIDLPPTQIFPYCSSYGKEELRTAWKEDIIKKNPSLTTPTSLPVVTQGLTQGLSLAGYLFLEPQDEIIIPDLHWENYQLIFSNTYKSQLTTFPLFQNNQFNLQGFKEKLFQQPTGKKVVLLNFPNNPTGYTPTTDEQNQIIQELYRSAEQGNKLLVICDDAYFGLVYKEGISKESIFAGLANLHPNILAIKIDGTSKEQFAWGLRIGFITFAAKGLTPNSYKVLEDKTAGAIRATLSNAPHLSQSLLLQTLASPNCEQEKQAAYNTLKERYKTVQQALSNQKYRSTFQALPCNSGYFICVALLNAEAEAVRTLLIKKFNTGVIAFGNLLRIAFSSLTKEEIPLLFENIYLACKEIEK
tara:strand:- start:134 stop:1423 length:1290 start_codon:yes stop_codon:yes gene_type:complete